jgi:hypothetical protein
MYLFHEKQYLVIVGEGFSRLSFFQVLHTSPYLMSLLVTQEFEYFICSCSFSDLFSLRVLCLSRLESFHLVSFSPLALGALFFIHGITSFHQVTKNTNTLENEK